MRMDTFQRQFHSLLNRLDMNQLEHPNMHFGPHRKQLGQSIRQVGTVKQSYKQQSVVNIDKYLVVYYLQLIVRWSY
jgi:hypothetical protein